MHLAQECGEGSGIYIAFPKSTLGLVYLYDSQCEAAEDVLQSGITIASAKRLKMCFSQDSAASENPAFRRIYAVVPLGAHLEGTAARGHFSEKNGMELFASLCRMFIAPVLISNGQMRRGVELLDKTKISLHENQRRTAHCLFEHILGQVYSQIAAGPKPSLPIMVKNAAYLIKTAPFAAKRAEEHFKKSIGVFSEIGANGFLGMADLGPGLFYKTQKQMNPAREYIGKAVEIFAASGAEVYLEQAEKGLKSLEYWMCTLAATLCTHDR